MSGSYTVAISILYLACGVVTFLLGLTFLRVARSNTPTRAAALMLFFAGVGPLLSASGLMLQHSLREGAVLYTSVVENFEYLWEFYFPSLLLFALTYPHENRVLRRYPVIGLVVFLPYLFHLAAILFGERMLEEMTKIPHSLTRGRELTLATREITLDGFDAVVSAVVRLLERVHRDFFALVNIVYSLVALDLLWRSQIGLVNPRLVRQLRTVGIGVAVSVACYTFAKVTLMTGANLLSQNATLALLNLSLIASGGAIAYAVIRQQFLGVRHVLRRGLFYGTVAALFALLYLVILRPIATFVAQYGTASRDAFEAGFVVLVVLAFQPMMERAEAVLERALQRGQGDAARRFKVLGDEVAAATTRETLEDVLQKGLRDTLDTGEVRLVVPERDDDPLPVALAEIGEPVRRRDLVPAGEPRRRRLRRAPQTPAVARASVPADALPPRVEMFVPVVQDRRCVAFVTLAEKVYALPYSAEEIGHLAVLSTQIGAALQKIRLLAESVEAKLFEEELKIARKIQTRMLPGDPPTLSGFEVFGVTVPSRQVGGDYYDFVAIDERRLGLVVADVSGKGIPASILSASLQATVHASTDAHTNPAEMMNRLNRLLYRNTSAAEFATAFYAVVDLGTGRVRYANAGHDFPFMVANGGARQLPESELVLGCMEDFQYRERSCDIPAGGSLVVFTDGVTDSESRSGENYGAGRLQSVLEAGRAASAREVCRRVIEDVRRFGDGENQDDLTLVVLKRAGP
jgi:serine phosphatase RsbU (regulator of sigma subunit)